MKYRKKEYPNLKVKVQLISNTLCLEFFFKVSPKKKKILQKERERERKKEQAQLLRFFFFFFSNTFEHYYCVDYSALHMGQAHTLRKRVGNFLHAHKPPKLCLFFLSLSFKKNYSRHILNFTENFIYMLYNFVM